MTLLLVAVLSLGILLWRADPSREWRVPGKWKTFISNWQRGFRAKTHTVHYVWDIGSEISEWERDFWYLQLALSRMQKKWRVPLWIKICLDQRMAIAQKDIYISCLQRRFPEFEISACLVSEENSIEGEL